MSTTFSLLKFPSPIILMISVSVLVFFSWFLLVSDVCYISSSQITYLQHVDILQCYISVLPQVYEPCNHLIIGHLHLEFLEKVHLQQYWTDFPSFSKSMPIPRFPILLNNSTNQHIMQDGKPWLHFWVSFTLSLTTSNWSYVLTSQLLSCMYPLLSISMALVHVITTFYLLQMCHRLLFLTSDLSST